MDAKADTQKDKNYDSQDLANNTMLGFLGLHSGLKI